MIAGPVPDMSPELARSGIDVLLYAAPGSGFAVCLDQITEIIEVEEFVKLSADDPSLRGALLARQRSLPMIDIQRRLGSPPVTRYQAPVLLVTMIDGLEVGFLIDDPQDVITVAEEDLRPLPTLVTRTQTSDAVYAVIVRENRLFLLLDLSRLVSAEEADDVVRQARLAFESASAESPEGGSG